MNTTATITKMKELRLKGMTSAFEASLQTKEWKNMTPDEFISYLVQSEWEHRQNYRLKVSLYKARFRYTASVEELSYGQGRNINQNMIMRLSDCSYIEKKENHHS